MALCCGLEDADLALLLDDGDLESALWPCAECSADYGDQHHIMMISSDATTSARDSRSLPEMKSVSDTPTSSAEQSTPCAVKTLGTKDTRRLTRARTPARPKFTSTHARQKYEIESLREQAQALEGRLSLLHAASGTAELSVCRETLAILQASSALEWKSIAKRQRDLHEESERKNRKLRRTIVAQTKLAKSLQRLLLMRAAKSAVRSLTEVALLGSCCLVAHSC